MPDGGPGAIRIEPFGDAAVLVRVGDGIDAPSLARSRALAGALERRRASTSWLGRPVPAWDSVLVPFDPLGAELETVRAVVVEAGRSTAEAEPGDADEPAIEIAVRYGGDDGPDLAAVAEEAGLRPQDVAALHADTQYVVAFLGFAPGFAYLHSVPAAIRAPRRATPRERVPAGSVAIAGAQTAVYPFAMPGGWNVIGRTDASLFDPGRTPPTPFRPGARVRFVPIVVTR